MAEATSITCERVGILGQQTVYEIRATASTTETITIPTDIPVSATDKVRIIAVNNLTDGTSVTDATTYDDGNRQFTYTESGASDEDVSILFTAGNND